jgi:hypothetical protein
VIRWERVGRRNVFMKHGQTYSCNPQQGLVSGAAKKSFVFLLLAFLLVSGLATATERPPAPRFPSIVVYVGSG